MSTQPGMSKASLKKKKKKFKSYFTNDSIPTSQILLLKRTKEEEFARADLVIKDNKGRRTC